MSNVNKELAFSALKSMSEKRKSVLRKALERNAILTSCPVLENCIATIYKEGWYFRFQGVRSEFRVFFADHDGTLVETRKPHSDALHKLYTDFFKCCESDFREIGIL